MILLLLAAKPTMRTAPATTTRAEDTASAGPQKLSTKRRSADSAEKMFMHSIDEEVTCRFVEYPGIRIERTAFILFK
jgi:hypothetical protein